MGQQTSTRVVRTSRVSTCRAGGKRSRTIVQAFCGMTWSVMYVVVSTHTHARKSRVLVTSDHDVLDFYPKRFVDEHI